MLRPRPAHLALVFFLMTGACELPPPTDTAIRTDSAGVLLVEHPRLPPIEASRIAIAAEPDLVLGEGGAFTGPDYEFFRISGVSQLRDGTLVVANAGSSELRFYGADGRFLRSVGREGDGPGEFRRMADVSSTAGDTVVVWDTDLRRLQHFSPDGAFVRAVSMSKSPFVEFSELGHPQAILENGDVVVTFESVLRPTQGRAERLPLLLALYGIDGGGWDSVRVVPGFERIVSEEGLPGYAFPAYTVAAGADATIAVADVARFRVELFDLDGRPVSVLSALVPEVPVTSDVLEAFIEHMVDHAPGWARTGEGADRYAERLRREVPASHASVLPLIRDVFVDADERIWVERYDVPGSGPSRWEVFARDGTWFGRVEMPEGFARGRSVQFAPGFSVAPGRLAGVWTDPYTGIETVRVYRVIEPDS